MNRGKSPNTLRMGVAAIYTMATLAIRPLQKSIFVPSMTNALHLIAVIVLFGHVMATVWASEHVHRNGRPSTDRQRVTGEFLHEGMKVLGSLFKSKLLPHRFVELHSSSCTRLEGRCTSRQRISI